MSEKQGKVGDSTFNAEESLQHKDRMLQLRSKELVNKEQIQKEITLRFFKYFEHWRDFDLLTCILAMIGLVLAITDYESRDWTMPSTIAAHIDDISFARMIISLLTFLTIVSLLFKTYMKTYWQDHKNVIDYQKMLHNLIESLTQAERLKL